MIFARALLILLFMPPVAIASTRADIRIYPIFVQVCAYREYTTTLKLWVQMGGVAPSLFDAVKVLVSPYCDWERVDIEESLVHQCRERTSAACVGVPYRDRYILIIR